MNAGEPIEEFFTRVLLAGVRENIEKYGWHNTHVSSGPDTHHFSYTTGFTELGHPELILIGLNPETVHQIFWTIFERVQDGRTFTHGLVTNKLLSEEEEEKVGPPPRMGFLEVMNPFSEDYPMSICRHIYPQGFQALQVVWPDAQDRMPWEDGYELSPSEQPLLGLPPTKE